MKKIIIKILPFVLGGLIGFILAEKVFSEIIPIYINVFSPVYPITVYGTLVASIIFFILIFQLIINKKVSKLLFIILFVFYFAFLLVALFCRSSFESFIILNPLTGLMDMFSEKEMLFQCFANFAIFIPAGYLVRKQSVPTTLGVSLIAAVCIEIIQYIFKLGFFDTFDILLYVLGVFVGRVIFKIVKIEFE